MDMEAAMKRIPPHSAEAEQAVLGAMLMNKEAITVASEILSGDDFYQTAYGILFNSMVELFHAGKPVDLITLQEYLKEKDVPPEISSMEFARDLLMGTQTSANIKSYAEIVREKSIMRRLIKVNEETANACYLQNQPLEEILEDAQKQVFALAETGNSEEYVPIKQVVLNALDVIERASKTKGTVTGIPTGFIDLDYKLSGLQRSDLVLIAAGFLGSQDYVTKAFGVEVNERTNVKTEAGKYSTNVKDVFTAGDMHRGQSLVVWAIREGREVAREVDESLMGYTNLYIQ